MAQLWSLQQGVWINCYALHQLPLRLKPLLNGLGKSSVLCGFALVARELKEVIHLCSPSQKSIQNEDRVACAFATWWAHVKSRCVYLQRQLLSVFLEE